MVKLQDILKFKQEESKRGLKKEKCSGCVWGRAIGRQYLCLFPECVKDKNSKKVNINGNKTKEILHNN